LYSVFIAVCVVPQGTHTCTYIQMIEFSSSVFVEMLQCIHGCCCCRVVLGLR